MDIGRIVYHFARAHILAFGLTVLSVAALLGTGGSPSLGVLSVFVIWVGMLGIGALIVSFYESLTSGTFHADRHVPILLGGLLLLFSTVKWFGLPGAELMSPPTQNQMSGAAGGVHTMFLGVVTVFSVAVAGYCVAAVYYTYKANLTTGAAFVANVFVAAVLLTDALSFALLTPFLPSELLTISTGIAEGVLQTMPISVAATLRQSFELTGLNQFLIWVALDIALGGLLSVPHVLTPTPGESNRSSTSQ